MGDVQLSFVEHLEELRRRLFISALVVVVASIGSYFFIDFIIALIEAPARGLDFIYISPPELFVAYMRIAVICGLAISSPVVLYQFWKFVKPALNKREQRYLLFALYMGVVFFAIGVSFAYIMVLPLALEFFVRIAAPGIEPLFSFAYYLGFVTSVLLAFGVVYQLPLFVVLLGSLGLVSPAFLRKHRKLVLLGIVVLSAFLTPPDVVSQVMLSGPIMLLYELSILLTVLITRKRRKKEQEEELEYIDTDTSG
ncbi:MAG: twin-arginine translocase subunit TatC [Spirochaetaceae bacterium]|nr:MAG: twin-arginine translocase subunit TatC [Spirochaetaceae bacterium]